MSALGTVWKASHTCQAGAGPLIKIAGQHGLSLIPGWVERSSCLDLPVFHTESLPRVLNVKFRDKECLPSPMQKCHLLPQFPHENFDDHDRKKKEGRYERELNMTFTNHTNNH